MCLCFSSGMKNFLPTSIKTKMPVEVIAPPRGECGEGGPPGDPPPEVPVLGWEVERAGCASGCRPPAGAPRPEPFLGRERAEVSQAGAGWGGREPCSLTCSHQELKLLPLIAYVSEVSGCTHANHIILATDTKASQEGQTPVPTRCMHKHRESSGWPAACLSP